MAAFYEEIYVSTKHWVGNQVDLYNYQVVWNKNPLYTSELTALDKVMETLFKEIA